MFVVPALPDFARDLDTTAGWATWTLTGYLLILAVSTPILGKLGDQHGKVKVVTAVLCLQLLASIGAAFAWDITSLIVFRFLQGPGGAIFPLLMALVSDEFPKRMVGTWLGAISSTMAMGTGLGLTLAGPLTEQLSWRAIFVVAAGMSAVALVLVVSALPESSVRSKGRTDWAGAGPPLALDARPPRRHHRGLRLGLGLRPRPRALRRRRRRPRPSGPRGSAAAPSRSSTSRMLT